MRCTGCFSDLSRLGRDAEETDRRDEKEFEEGERNQERLYRSCDEAVGRELWLLMREI